MIATNNRVEKELSKSNEKRLLAENAELAKERSRQQSLMDNLQSLLQAKERNDNELKQRINNEIEGLQKEW